MRDDGDLNQRIKSHLGGRITVIQWLINSRLGWGGDGRREVELEITE